jgi:hypothetical protein
VPVYAFMSVEESESCTVANSVVNDVVSPLGMSGLVVWVTDQFWICSACCRVLVLVSSNCKAGMCLFCLISSETASTAGLYEILEIM